MPRRTRRWMAPACGAVMVSICVAPAAAHERQTVGQYHLTIGWGDEPAYTGFKNAVTLAIADAAGAPVADAGASLSVEVSFGNERVLLPLQPAFQRPGEFRAVLVPTRSGTYSFHFTGSVKGQSIETTSTCSDQTFHCVAESTDIQFPAKDPSPGQLADGISRALLRAERANDSAATAQKVAAGALALSVVAIGVALVLAFRGGRKVA